MTAGEALSNYLSGLDPKERLVMSRKIRRACDISRNVLYNWTIGATAIKTLYRDKITEVTGTDIFANVAKCENWHE